MSRRSRKKTTDQLYIIRAPRSKFVVKRGHVISPLEFLKLSAVKSGRPTKDPPGLAGR
mgnify:FL=1